MGCFSQGSNSFHQKNVLFVRSQIAISKNSFQKYDLFKYDIFRPTVKYVITAFTPKIIIKKFNFFFFIKYKNEWKERKLRTQKNQNK